MNNYISLVDLYNAIIKDIERNPHGAIGYAFHAINSLIAGLQSKEAEWEDVDPDSDNYIVKCSLCGWYSYKDGYGNVDKPLYCAGCGARMINGELEEEDE